jgi:hypothetical protein
MKKITQNFCQQTKFQKKLKKKKQTITPPQKNKNQKSGFSFPLDCLLEASGSGRSGRHGGWLSAFGPSRNWAWAPSLLPLSFSPGGGIQYTWESKGVLGTWGAGWGWGS